MPYVQTVMTEFWTHEGKYSPFELVPTVAALRKSGQNIIEAEAFTGDPRDSKWNETPEWLKPIGDAAFCDGVNRLVIHRFVQQSFNDKYKPGLTMGDWGTHFDRTQTWWEPGKETINYWKRCQALLQWGNIASANPEEFNAANLAGDIIVKHIHRHLQHTDVFFVANIARNKGSANCFFNIQGMQPEIWDPVTGSMRDLPQFKTDSTGITIPIEFEKAQSFFIVFRRQLANHSISMTANFRREEELLKITGPWQVQFDQRWGGPQDPVTFNILSDWTTREEKGIKYFSGTAVYRKKFDGPLAPDARLPTLYLDLGVVKHIARVTLNNKDLGVIWTAPWHVKIPAGLLRTKDNELLIEVTNVWANRLIGDEQEPDDCEWIPGFRGGKSMKEFPEWFLKNEPRPSKGRYCFTTWNYFDKNSPLVSSGLLGPVRITGE